MIRSYTYQEFLPLEELARRKREAGTTVSLVVPALNEEPTIGRVISAVVGDLAHGAGLVDEVVVIDGGSEDGTVRVARDCGAMVHRATEVMPHVDCPAGKGTSLWKSLFVTSGDILVFLDADVVEFESRFAYGLLGALLDDQRLYFAKAFYARPLVVDGSFIDNHGGRVTEILARPLLSAWFPELARLRQPLAGEYAFRRAALEQLPFCCGYGVEIKLILGLYRLFGTEHMAQVDMGMRVHRNRPVGQLGKMSFAILETFLRFLREEGMIDWAEEPSRTMIAPASEGWEEEQIDEPTLAPAEMVRKESAGGRASAT